MGSLLFEDSSKIEIGMKIDESPAASGYRKKEKLTTKQILE